MEEDQQMALYRNLVQRREQDLATANANLRVQLDVAAPRDTRTASSTDSAEPPSPFQRWQEDNNRAQESVIQAAKSLAEAKRLLKDLVNEAAGVSQGQQFRFSRLPAETMFAKFKPTLNTSKRNCKEFLSKFANTLATSSVPFKEGPAAGQQRFAWYDALHLAFAKPDREQELFDWIDGHRRAETPWDEFQRAFTTHFAKDDANTSAKNLFKDCQQQPHQDVAKFYAKFTKLAKDSMFGDVDPPPGWLSNFQFLGQQFLEKLKPHVAKATIDHTDCSATVINDCEQLANLAKRVEQNLNMKKNLLANLAGEGGSKARRSNIDLQKRKRGGRADASSQRSNSSKADASTSSSKCARCQRKHKGGAANCWQTKLPDGTPIASKPTATNPFASNKRQDGASKCQHCGSDRHTSATCYVKNNKRRDSDSGRRQQAKAIKRRKLANGLPAKKTRFAAVGSGRDSGDEADRASSSEGSEGSYSPTSQ